MVVAAVRRWSIDGNAANDYAKRQQVRIMDARTLPCYVYQESARFEASVLSCSVELTKSQGKSLY